MRKFCARLSLAVLLLASVAAGVKQGRAQMTNCPQWFSQGHSAYCFQYGFCASWYAWCTVFTCSVNGEEASHGCSEGWMSSCTPGGCFVGVFIGGCAGC